MSDHWTNADEQLLQETAELFDVCPVHESITCCATPVDEDGFPVGTTVSPEERQAAREGLLDGEWPAAFDMAWERAKRVQA